MEIDHQTTTTTTRKRCRDDFAADDFAEVVSSFPTAKKTRQSHSHSHSHDAAHAFASAFALAQATHHHHQHHPFLNSSSSSLSSSPSYTGASSPNESSHSSPGPQEIEEDPFRAAMVIDSEMITPMQDVLESQSQLQSRQCHQQLSLHPPPGRRGMIIAGWNQARRNDMAPVVQCWPQRR